MFKRQKLFSLKIVKLTTKKIISLLNKTGKHLCHNMQYPSNRLKLTIAMNHTLRELFKLAFTVHLRQLFFPCSKIDGMPFFMFAAAVAALVSLTAKNMC